MIKVRFNKESRCGNVGKNLSYATFHSRIFDRKSFMENITNGKGLV